MNFQQTSSVFDFDNPAISRRGVSSVGCGDPGRGRGGRGGLGGGGNRDARKPTQERDSEENPVEQSHPNPTLYTRSYIVVFNNNDQTELTANLIAKSMYAQCDPDGNQYLLLADIVDHRSFPTAINFPTKRSYVLMAVPTYNIRLLAGNFAASG